MCLLHSIEFGCRTSPSGWRATIPVDAARLALCKLKPGLRSRRPDGSGSAVWPKPSRRRHRHRARSSSLACPRCSRFPATTSCRSSTPRWRPIDLVHVRHEAATVHMADAWGRLTGEPGIAMVTGGPGHANAVGALYHRARRREPDGAAVRPRRHLGAWPRRLPGDRAGRPWPRPSPRPRGWRRRPQRWRRRRQGVRHRPLRPARSGAPEPAVRPARRRTSSTISSAWPKPTARAPRTRAARRHRRCRLSPLQEAARPLILGAPAPVEPQGRALLAELEQATSVPVVVMESPRGIN